MPTQNIYHFQGKSAAKEIDLSYLRPLRRKKVQEQFDAFRFRGKLNAFSYEDALVLPGKNKKGGVLDKNGQFVKESKTFWFGGAYEYDSREINYDARKVVFLGEYSSHWGHAFVSLLVRFWYCLSNKEEVDAYVIIKEEPDQKQDSTSLNSLIRLAGIAEKVIYIDRPTRFKEVIVPDPSFTAYSYTDEWRKTIDTIKQNALKESNEMPRLPTKIFLSRSHFARAKRNEGGLELLDDFFENNGFTIIYPEEHSFPQMVSFMENAEICASESGTITFNTLFGSENLQVIIIERTAVFPNGNMIINLSHAKRITYIDGHYTVYPSNVGGPCILGFTDCFERFADNNYYQHPSPIYLESPYRKKCFEIFEKTYIATNPHERFLKTNKGHWLPVVYEAFLASIDHFPWLDKEVITKKYYANIDFSAP